MNETTTYQIITLPKPRDGPAPDAKLIALAEKYRKLRLRALQAAPEAFAATYEGESQRDLSQTIERLSDQKAVHFVATSIARTPTSSPLEDSEAELDANSKWLGMIVLLGPQVGDGNLAVEQDPFRTMTAKGEVLSSVHPSLHSPAGSTALHFHLNGVFVDPSARGGGLGKALMDAALQRAEAEARRERKGLRLTISVFDHNVAARKMYEKAGFEVISETVSRSKPGSLAVHMQRSRAAIA